MRKANLSKTTAMNADVRRMESWNAVRINV
jgi:hypothetical protein